MTRYWLLKSEPGCFSIDDLRASPDGVAAWDGVRNFQARNLLRDAIAVGDGVLFYHSNIAEPAIVGVAWVVRNGYPDHTACDPQGEHFDPRASRENPIWYMVDVAYVAHMPRPLLRRDLAAHPLLAGMEVLRKGSRLSVQPVTEAQWQTVLAVGGLSNLDWLCGD
jgi:predicted RNA-binding protein with PUA-like domain